MKNWDQRILAHSLEERAAAFGDRTAVRRLGLPKGFAALRTGHSVVEDAVKQGTWLGREQEARRHQRFQFRKPGVMKASARGS
jgi:hypothetical protein